MEGYTSLMCKEWVASLHMDLQGGKNETCGTCYGAGGDDDCCNTCSDVMLAYRLRRWALPRIEDVEQCRWVHMREGEKEMSAWSSMCVGVCVRNDPQAASMYRPPTIIRLGDFNLGQIIPSIIEQGKRIQSNTHTWVLPLPWHVLPVCRSVCSPALPAEDGRDGQGPIGLSRRGAQGGRQDG